MAAVKKSVLITAGPTIEYWDSVRYLTNRSSGKTGLEIARYARKLGARVTLVSAIKKHAETGLRHIIITSARDMFKVIKSELKEHNIFISAAAVSDFYPVYQKGKIDKRKGLPKLKLKKNPDILKWAGRNKDNCIIAGFSLQEKIDIKKAVIKKKEKNCDIIVVNRINNLDSNRKAFVLISDTGIERYQDVDIREMAEIVVKECLKTEKNS